MKPSEIRALSAAVISQEVEARKKELMELRFQAAVGQLAKPSRVRELRKEIARLLTVAGEQRRAQAAQASAGSPPAGR